MLTDVLNGLEFYRTFWRPGELAVSNMERRGICLDQGTCSTERLSTYDRGADLLAKLEADRGVVLNWGSPKQVADYLYTRLGLPVPPVSGTSRAVKMTKKVKYSIMGRDLGPERPTSEAALEYLRDHNFQPWIQTLLDWKNIRKLESFWATLPGHVGRDGRIHPQLSPSTETGRLSCKNPNLQQQPPETRRAFVARYGNVLVALDYKALEWRVLAHVLAHRYKDMSLVEEIMAGVDPHEATGKRMGLAVGTIDPATGKDPEREKAKILNYSINYGKTGAGLGVQIRDKAGNGIGTEAGEQLLKDFYEARPGIARFHRDIVRYAQGRGGVRSLLGRFRPITEPFEVRTRWGVKEGPGARQAKNVIQNCATDVVWMAMIRVDESPKLQAMGAELILQNHDELVLEVPERHAEEALNVASDLMVNCLSGVRDFLCPLGVDGGFGPSWADC